MTSAGEPVLAAAVAADSVFAPSKRVLLLLQERGANLRATTPDGKTALHFAAFRNDGEAVAFLIDQGLDVSASDGQGKTPLDLARFAEAEDAIAQLLAAAQQEE